MQVRTALDSCKDFRNLLTSKLNEIEELRKASSFKDFCCKNKQVVCMLFEDIQNVQNHFQSLFQRLKFLEETCGTDLQYPRSQQTSMEEIQTSF